MLLYQEQVPEDEWSPEHTRQYEAHPMKVTDTELVCGSGEDDVPLLILKLALTMKPRKEGTATVRSMTFDPKKIMQKFGVRNGKELIGKEVHLLTALDRPDAVGLLFKDWSTELLPESTQTRGREIAASMLDTLGVAADSRVTINSPKMELNDSSGFAGFESYFPKSEGVVDPIADAIDRKRAEEAKANPRVERVVQGFAPDPIEVLARQLEKAERAIEDLRSRTDPRNFN